MKWNKLPSKWEQCAYIGNGLIGASIYKHSDSILRWELGRTDVTAHYKLKNIDWMVPRVLIGDLFLKPKGKVFNKSNMNFDTQLYPFFKREKV
jgi:hypothetical protein